MFFYASPQTRQFISIAYMVMGGLDTILISLTTFVILRKSSQDMRIYKYVQLNIMFSSFLFDITTVIGQTFMLLPYPGILLLSPFDFSQFSMMILSSFWLTGFCSSINSILCSCYYRLYVLSFGYMKERLKKGVPWLGLIYLNLFPNQILTWLAYLDGAVENTQKMITTIPELSILKDEKSVLIFDLNEIWFRFYLLWVSVSMTLIIGAMATMKYTILKWLTHQKKHLSPVALAFHNQMILTLFLQAFISFTCSCLPYTAALLSAFGVTGIPDIVTSLCSLYGSFHSAPSCLLILMTTTPYRQYVLNMFDFRLKRTQPVSPNQTTIVFTRWNYGKGRQSQRLQVIF